MNRLLILVMLLIAPVIAGAISIEYIDIQARGDKLEVVKNHASNNGIKRAFILLADRLNAKSDKLLDQTNFDEIKALVKSYDIINENYDKQLYSASMTVDFDRYNFYQLLLKKSPAAVKLNFIEYLVIPIFKLGDKIYYDPKVNAWNQLWQNHREFMSQNKIELMDFTNIHAQQILNENAITDLIYDDFEFLIDQKLIKNIVVVLAEYDTDFETRKSFLNVEYYYTYSDKVLRQKSRYLIPDDSRVELLIKDIIDKFIDDHKPEYMRNPTLIEQLENDKWQQPKQDEFVVFLEVYNQQDWNNVRNKLSKIKNINRISLIEQKGNNLKILLEHNMDQKQLAKALYDHGLTYMTKNRRNYLLEVFKQ